MCTWNVLTLGDNDHLPLLSTELHRLGIIMRALSETRKPGTAEVAVGENNYFWSGRFSDWFGQGVSIVVASRLVPCRGNTG